jgi:hypothetical protein
VNREVGLPLLAVLMLVSAASDVARARVAQETPGTVAREWTIRWPEKGEKRALLKRFVARPGLIRRVRVLIEGKPVARAPYLSIVGCKGSRYLATAQRSWLWDGRNVYVALLLDPGRCNVAGTRMRARVVLTTVGT